MNSLITTRRPERTIHEWDIYCTLGGSRRVLTVYLSNPALKAALSLLRQRGYKSMYPKKGMQIK